jgi:hypothetical protein
MQPFPPVEAIHQSYSLDQQINPSKHLENEMQRPRVSRQLEPKVAGFDPQRRKLRLVMQRKQLHKVKAKVVRT